MSASADPQPASPRIVATPYARRLARERAISLHGLRGTGPDGRIVARDVTEYQPSRTDRVTAATLLEARPAAPIPVQAPAAVQAIPASAALAASIDLGAVTALLAQFRELSLDIALEDFCLKAASVALQQVPAVGDGILLTAGRGEAGRILKGIHSLALGAISALRRGDANAAVDRPALALSFLRYAGIRAVAASLAGDAAARLVVAAAADSEKAECLLSYDADRLDDDDAAELLRSFKTLMETPLRLLA